MRLRFLQRCCLFYRRILSCRCCTNTVASDDATDKFKVELTKISVPKAFRTTSDPSACPTLIKFGILLPSIIDNEVIVHCIQFGFQHERHNPLVRTAI